MNKFVFGDRVGVVGQPELTGKIVSDPFRIVRNDKDTFFAQAVEIDRPFWNDGEHIVYTTIILVSVENLVMESK